MNREQAINYLISSGFTHEQVGEVVRALTYEPTTKNNSKFCPDRKAKTTHMETFLHCVEDECVAYKDGKCLKYNSDQEPTTKNDLVISSVLEKNSKKLEKDFGELDCISRADVNQVIEDYMDEQYDTLSDRTRERAFGAKTVMARINELPSVTPRPREGHWITDAKTYYEELNKRGLGVDEYTPYFTDDIACSECLAKYSMLDNETQFFKYCPNCGADMREVKE